MSDDSNRVTGVPEAIAVDLLLGLGLGVGDVLALSQAERVAKISEAISDGRIDADHASWLRSLGIVPRAVAIGANAIAAKMASPWRIPLRACAAHAQVLAVGCSSYSLLAMTYSLKELRAVSDEELVARHDAEAKNASASVNYYLDELARRGAHEQGERMVALNAEMVRMTRTISRLTIAIAVLTVVNVVAVLALT
jgi:hypothetical protein